jgi:uncharacterized membrane protein YphA (DoxX/SURF4 family)
MAEAKKGPGSVERALQVVVGLVFVVAGLGKLALPFLIPYVRPGSPTFADVLGAIGLPMPETTALVICVVELAGGALLLGGRLPRLAAIALAGDMVGALVTLSVPATFFGQPVQLGGLELGAEPWRVPLEAGLLVVCLGLARPWRPKELLAGR